MGTYHRSSLLPRSCVTGVKESDTGLASPNLWDLPADKQRQSSEHPLQVARCTKIIRLAPANADGSYPPPPTPAGGPGAKPNADEQDQYVINVKQIAKFVVGLGDRVAPTDIEEGMRVGCVQQRPFAGCADAQKVSIARITRFRSRSRPESMRP